MERNEYRPAAGAPGGAKRPPQKRPPVKKTEQAPEQASVVMNLNQPEEPAPKKKSRWWIWLIVGILVVGIGVAAGFLLLSPKEKEEAPEVAPEPELTYVLDNYVVFENEQCAFIIDEIGEKGDYLELDVRCVNKTVNPLSFTWESTCLNGSMFDPQWNGPRHTYITVLGNSTMKSSITFPLSTLDTLNLLPANELKFILHVFDDFSANKLAEESSKYIKLIDGETRYKNFRKIKGYDGYFFSPDVKVDDDKRPYYVNADKERVYFDEIYHCDGRPLYPINPDEDTDTPFYNDALGRPYYFIPVAGKIQTVYYDGYGYAFTDPVSGKHYFYDENGTPAFYGFSGIPEYYTDEIPQDLVEEGKPHILEKAFGHNIVHKEFTIYPTGLSAEEVERPNRVFASSEEVYWAGEKGNFLVLGGTMDEFQGYIVHTYIENLSDNYIYFGWDEAKVNGANANGGDDRISVLRPHSTVYWDVLIPNDLLKENSIKTVQEVKFRVFAVGENLSVPLYPIVWEARDLAGLTK